MKSSFKFLVLSSLVLVVLFASGNMIPNVAGAAPTIGWDTISVTVVNGTLTLNPGGSGYALGNDHTTIQVSGSGTFGGGVAPTGGGASGPAGPAGPARRTVAVNGVGRLTRPPAWPRRAR